ncbi:MAG: hypothetical protein M3137_06805 [Actinomycetota bacterium]|nr:hypothetical protein [Actinomycetota bacterium]
MTEPFWASHPADADAPPDPPGQEPLTPDLDWVPLREAWEPDEAPSRPWPLAGPASRALAAATTASVPVTDAAGNESDTVAHKVVPRPGAAHRISTTGRSRPETGPRPSQAPFRVGMARRMRSGFALILISVVFAGLVAAVLVAAVAGIATAISHAASS